MVSILFLQSALNKRESSPHPSAAVGGQRSCKSLGCPLQPPVSLSVSFPLLLSVLFFLHSLPSPVAFLPFFLHFLPSFSHSEKKKGGLTPGKMLQRVIKLLHQNPFPALSLCHTHTQRHAHSHLGAPLITPEHEVDTGFVTFHLAVRHS